MIPARLVTTAILGEADRVPEPRSEAVAARPSGPLAGVVAEHHGYLQKNVAPAVHRGLPSPYLTVIVTLDEPLVISQQVDASRRPDSYRALVGGLHTSPALVRHHGAQSGIQLRMSPLGARALFGLPAGELVGIDLHATEVLGRVAAELHERVAAAADWTERFAVLDAVLGARLDPAVRPPAEVCRAWQLLLASHGTVPISAVAADVGWSQRHLAARFRTEIGLTPKTAARVIRFDRARRMLPSADGAAVAARCGYADQAHLVRDFRAFTGLAPTAWLAAEVGNLQVSTGRVAAELAS
jgi:AraC-like DNA-binding protein